MHDVLCLGGGGLKPDAICLHPAPWQEQAKQCFGVRCSHGCVRLSSATARWLFERTPVGTPVVIQDWASVVLNSSARRWREPSLGLAWPADRSRTYPATVPVAP
ncbi:L,D-transpeptidase [Vulcanococcus limneticus]|uniref:L,D-transpeptidase n=1 Tax=Vulcanococcus limneticus TaxID=2170428 RepID=UPI0028F42AFB|nr:L,D-transpeptidase family protein [Vulcanococcus limneticus]